MNNCPTCGKEAKVKYCSRDCANKAKKVNWECVCQVCGKTFYHKNAAYNRLGRMKTCSEGCKNRKYTFDENYFSSELTEEKLITLGQIIAIGTIINFRTVRLISDRKTLEDLNLKLNSNHKLANTQNGQLKINIFSDQFTADLQRLGLIKGPHYQDVPREDLWEGISRTHCFVEEKYENVFTTKSSKIAHWVRDKFDGEIFTRIYREIEEGDSLNPIFIVIWKRSSIEHNPSQHNH
jgi:hypothetical protein